jgi:hypothetical protein
VIFFIFSELVWSNLRAFLKRMWYCNHDHQPRKWVCKSETTKIYILNIYFTSAQPQRHQPREKAKDKSIRQVVGEYTIVELSIKFRYSCWKKIQNHNFSIQFSTKHHLWCKATSQVWRFTFILKQIAAKWHGNKNYSIIFTWLAKIVVTLDIT